MASAAGLAIALSATGVSGVEKAFDGIAKTIGGVGKAASNVASAPLKAFGGAIGEIGKMAAGVALGGALTELPGKLMEMAKGAAADEQATARLSQTIRNLGGDFDGITDQVNEAIAAGQKLAFTDDDVRDSFQTLAVATGDADEALRRQKVAMDLARGANIPLATATKMLSKVNEENVEAFKKLGITIGENATEADALAAVQAKYAGQSEAYANSTAGQFEQAQIALAEIQESIGSALLPLFTTFAQVVASALPVVQEWVGALAGGISETIMPVLQPFIDMLPDIATALQQAFSFFATGSGDIEMFRGVLNALIGPTGAQGVIDVFTNLTGFVQSTLIPMFQSFGQIVGKVLQGDFGGAIQAAGAHIATFGPKLIATLADWGQRFLAWVAPLIPPLLAELAKLGAQLLGWVGDRAPDVLAKLGEWGKQFIDFIGPIIPPMLAEALKLVGRLLAFIGEQAPILLAKFNDEWLPAALKWVAKAAIDIIPKLLAFLNDVKLWLDTTGKDEIGRAALGLGKSLVDGMISGAVQNAGKLDLSMAGLVKAAIEAGMRAARTGSPSKETRDKIGIPMAQGIIEGIEVKGPALDNALSDAVGQATKSAQREAVRTGGALAELLTSSRMYRAARNTDDWADGLANVATQIGAINQLLPGLANGLVNLPQVPGGGGGWGLFPTPGPTGAGASGSPTINATVTVDARGMDQRQATAAVTDGLVGAAHKLVTGRSF